MKNINILLNILLNILKNIEFWDLEDEQGTTYWGAALVCGYWNPTEAEYILRRAQKRIFQLMAEAGKPLYGYLQLDTFLRCVDEGNSLETAYKAASKEMPQYQVRLTGGSGTEEDPFVFE